MGRRELERRIVALENRLYGLQNTYEETIDALNRSNEALLRIIRRQEKNIDQLRIDIRAFSQIQEQGLQDLVDLDERVSQLEQTPERT